MGQIEDLDLFVRVVDAGSITKAAQDFGIAKSAVSRRLAGLEARLETILIERGPGRWAVTDRGAALMDRARALVTEAAGLEADFQNPRLALQGPLRLSLPRDFALGCLSGALLEFMQLYPQIELHLSFEDRMVDLAHENFDAALRITSGDVGKVQAQLLGQSGASLCASPAYLEQAPALEKPEDLQHQTWLGYGTEARTSISLRGKAFDLHAAHTSNSGLFLLEAAMQGAGIIGIPNFLSQEAVAKGKLVRVLTAFSLPTLKIYLCRSPQARPNRRVSLFADHIARALEGTNW